MPHETESTLERLRRVLLELRERTPANGFTHSEAAMSDLRTGYIDGVPVKRLVITLRSPGCEWVRRGGGCIMCGHHAGTTHGVVPSANDFMTQFETELHRYNLKDIEVISIYNSGSMLNQAELPAEALKEILRHISRLPRVKKVVLESRAEYVDQEVIAEYTDILGKDKRLSIAIGLETANDVYRELCLNKGVTSADISAAVKSLKGLAETQIYVFLGIPFLTEREMLDDTIQTLRYAAELGADEIHIEPATLQEHTLLKGLAALDMFRLPSLYSLYEALKAVVPEICPYVSPFMHMPLPERIPEGCPKCTDRLIEGLLGRYNIEHTVESLDYEDCACQSEWRERLVETDPRPIETRIAAALDALEDSR